jgi:hypothetical protein
MKVDYIIAGPGLTDRLMAYELSGQGNKFFAFNHPENNNSQAVASCR